ncbi:MAG: 1,4-dihydroxy-2-naphthoate octaprenyltransferase [Zoogloeaceae bacterium]|nr:1,4-dihydroxy-2-naphthoate octaprenyltransferase [Zoogloeaceae bacterium]
MPLENTPPRLDAIYAWIVSLRLRTLPLACCGIVTGNALAVSLGAVWRGAVFWLTLATAILLQLLANLANDYGDFTKSADTSQRLGPKRGMQLGLITPEAMRKAIGVTALLAMFSGIILMAFACASLADFLVFLGLGLVSLVAALTYTVGRHAYGYHGLGDLAVLVFFGWVAVCGSFYLQTRAFAWQTLAPATACGLLCVIVLNVNNMRDLREDRLHGKITLAVRLGERGARWYHLALLAAGFAFLVWSACLLDEQRPWVWLFLLALPFFCKNALAALRYREPEQFRAQLGIAIQISIVALGGFAAGQLIG